MDSFGFNYSIRFFLFLWCWGLKVHALEGDTVELQLFAKGLPPGGKYQLQFQSGSWNYHRVPEYAHSWMGVEWSGGEPGPDPSWSDIIYAKNPLASSYLNIWRFSIYEGEDLFYTSPTMSMIPGFILDACESKVPHEMRGLVGGDLFFSIFLNCTAGPYNEGTPSTPPPPPTTSSTTTTTSPSTSDKPLEGGATTSNATPSFLMLAAAAALTATNKIIR